MDFDTPDLSGFQDIGSGNDAPVPPFQQPPAAANGKHDKLLKALGLAILMGGAGFDAKTTYDGITSGNAREGNPVFAGWTDNHPWSVWPIKMGTYGAMGLGINHIASPKKALLIDSIIGAANIALGLHNMNVSKGQ